MISFIVLIILSMTYCQQIMIGEKCKCVQLLTLNDCQKISSCYWDNQLMQCKQSIDIYSQKYLLENIDETKQNKAHSFFCNSMTYELCQKESSCVWFKGTCTHFTGCTAYFRETHEQCQELSKLCISDAEICVNIDDCTTYKNSYSCSYDRQGKYCNWDTVKNKCNSASQCNQLPLTLKTHQECQNQSEKCTTKSGGGCIELTYLCHDMKEPESCLINSGKNKTCFWNGYKCLEKTCDNAPNTLKNDQECKLFLQECTTKLGGGCVVRTQCKDAQVQEACITNQYGEGCLWNGVQCLDNLCENAPSSYTTYEQCQSIHKVCITNGNGCVSNYGCEFAPSQQYCYQDADNKDCIWLGNNCIRKECQHAGHDYRGHEQCQSFMFSCTGNTDQSGCVEKTCQNAPLTFSTNQECESYLPNNQCITKKGGGCRKNVMCVYIDIEAACKIDSIGSACFWNYKEDKCQKITTCSSILNQLDCIKDNNNQECEWISLNKCVLKSCDTAPLQISTEKQCQEYFYQNDGRICTSKLNGGCKIKSTCQNQETQESCNKDVQGNECFWNDQLKVCKQKECNDIQSNSFQDCFNQNKNCTIGLNGHCVKLKQCNQIINKYECIYGQDGPCLWIDNYSNKGGQCFQYNSCSSMKWQTDKECKLISNYCTTNGQECVAIRRCQETNTNGGCITGVEGMCIQSVTALGVLEQPKCQIFLNCNQAYYLTHKECQKANTYCTTNGVTGCRSLASCDYYVEEACHINNEGIQRNERNQVISTGNCIWDNQYNVCRNEDCKDLKYKSKEDCQNALQTCTSDGEKCISKMMCSDYRTEQLCNYALGMEGSCIWKQKHCTQKTCQDITSNCEDVDNCISDGIRCIQKKNCSEYKNQISCNSIGLDGLCYWDSTSNQCNLMNGCSSANNDQIACQQANDRCFWQPQSQNQPSQCKEHTCSSYENQSGECSHYLSWDWQSYNICRFVSYQCINFDVKSLTEHTCLIYSLELYKWNPISSTCTECDTGQNQQNNNKSPIPQGSGIAEILISKIISAIIIITQMII